MPHILTQGSTGAIGDFFISSNIMYNIHRYNPVSVALKEKCNVSHLYERVKFFKTTHILSDIEWDNFEGYCKERGFIPHYYLKSINLEAKINCFGLSWFDTRNCTSTVNGDCVIVHVASSSNYKRPSIPNLETWVNYIEEAGFIPVFIGGESDGILFKEQYSGIYDKYHNTDNWRIGKDTLWQSIGNIISCRAALVFSSWSSIVSALAGKYTIELWGHDQVLFYGSIIKYYLGSPVNLVQIPYTYIPPYNYFCSSVMRDMELRGSVWRCSI